MNLWLLTIPLAYLLGSIPFGYILVRLFLHQDIRATGSGNIGATNVARSGKKTLAIATLVLDALKGYVAVMIALHISHGSLNLGAAAAVAAIIGHIFPIWLSFKGGKGIATALGVFLALSWPTALCALAVFIIVTLASRYVSLGSILGAAALPMFMMYFQPYRSPMFVGGTIFISLLCILKHRANIARLKAGTESRLGSKKAAPEPTA
jgi:acyl phosphate:glycerol-3-phosphate acyltransferase